MNKINGFVMLPVLMFMQITSLFGLYELSAGFLNIKMDSQLWSRRILDYSAQQQLVSLEKIAKFQCLIPTIASTELVKKPISWWQQVACYSEANGIQSYYVIEFLGKDPCAIVELDNQTLIAEYYRITVLAVLHSLKKAKSAWQSTIAQASKEIEICGSKKHRVFLGRQMWRELI